MPPRSPYTPANQGLVGVTLLSVSLLFAITAVLSLSVAPGPLTAFLGGMSLIYGAGGYWVAKQIGGDDE